MSHHHCAPLLLAFLTAALPPAAHAYDISHRWTSTQTDGDGLGWGDATTVTWSVVPDGEGYCRAEASDLVAYLDDAWGVSPPARVADLTGRPWWALMDRAYAQYSRTSGLALVYAAEQLADGGDSGAEGDIRIGGVPFTWDADGVGGVLADSLSPNDGDMRIDTNREPGGAASPWHSHAAAFRNLIAHESGHGMGLSHSDVVSGAQALMQPSLLTDVWGLQFDDVYALNRLYGDPLEKNGGNDTRATATPLGDLGAAGSVSLGRDAGDAVVEEMDGDWAGVDSAGDVDWYRFQVAGRTRAGLTVTPMGPTYVTEEQGEFNAAAQSDLTARLYGPDHAAPLATLRLGGRGEAESVAGFTLPAAGDYYVRVHGAQDRNQFYRLDLNVADAAGDAVEPLVVLRDGFDGGELNADRLEVGRQAGGRVDSPYAVRRSAPGGAVAQVTGDALALSSTAGASGAFTQVDLLRNFAPELAGERWAASFSLELDDLATTDASWFAFLFDDAFEPAWPQSGDAQLSVQLTADGDLTATEGGQEGGGASVARKLGDHPHQFRLLVDETGDAPLLDLWVDGVTLIDNEPIALAADGRYFSFRLWNAAGEAIGATLDAAVDDLLVSLVPEMTLPGDFDRNGVVDQRDYERWREAFGTADLLADANDDGRVTMADYAVWRDNLGATAPAGGAQVPEPGGGVLAVCGAALLAGRRQRPSSPLGRRGGARSWASASISSRESSCCSSKYRSA